MTGLQGTGLRHTICNEALYQPRIAFKKQKKTVFEKTGAYLWCRKCKEFVKVEIRQK
jgi:hypothetical protein